MRNISLFILVTTVLPTALCRWIHGYGRVPRVGSTIVYPTPLETMVDVTNDLAISVLQDYAFSKGNFAFSPYGVASVLVVLYEGARGETARQIHHALRLPWNRDVTRIGYRDIHRHLRSYFTHEGYLSGMTLSKNQTALRPEYQRILRFYGYDIDLMKEPTATTTDTVTTEDISTDATTSMFEIPDTGTTSSEEIKTITSFKETTPVATTVSPKNEVFTMVFPTTPEPEEKLSTEGKVNITKTSESSSRAMTSEPPTEAIPSEPSSQAMHTEPSTEIMTSEPSSQAMTSEPSTEIMTSEPSSQAMTSEPSSEAIPSEPSSEAIPSEPSSQEMHTEHAFEAMPSESPSQAMTSEPSTEIMTSEPSSEGISTESTEDTSEMDAGSPTTEMDYTLATELTEPETETAAESLETEETTPTLGGTVEAIGTSGTTYPFEFVSGHTKAVTDTPGSEDTTPCTKMEELKEVTTPIPKKSTQPAGKTIRVIARTTPRRSNTDLETHSTNIFTQTTPIRNGDLTEETTDNQSTSLSTNAVTSTTSELSFTTRIGSTPSPTDVTPTLLTFTREPSRRGKDLKLDGLKSYPQGKSHKQKSLYGTTQQPTTTRNASSTETTSPWLMRKKRHTRSIRRGSLYPDMSLQLDNGMYDSYVDRERMVNTRLPRYHFLVDGNVEEEVPVMAYTTVFPFAYIRKLKALALEFPLDDPRYRLLLLLPIESRGLPHLINAMRIYPLRQVYEALRPTRVNAIIPSFMVEGFVILTPSLQQMGIWDVFDPRRCDLGGMSDDPELYVRNIEQSITVVIRNYLEVLDIHTRTMAARMLTERFIATHPFLYFVMDTETHVTLMAGKVVDPLNSRIY